MFTEKAYKTPIENFTNREERCIEICCDHYARKLSGVILKLTSDKALVQVFLQETFIRIWQGSNSYDPNDGRLFTWMIPVARKTVLNKLQRNSHQNGSKTHGPDKFFAISSQQNRDDTFDSSLIVSDIENKYVQVLKLVYFHHYILKEIIDVLRLSLRKVKSYVKIGLRHLCITHDCIFRNLSGSTSLLTLNFI